VWYATLMVDMILSSGIPIQVKQIPNLLVFKSVSGAKLQVPQPPIFVLDDGRETENTQHPAYQDAITVFEVQRNNLAFEVLLEHAVTFDKKLLQKQEWKRMYQNLRFQKYLNLPKREDITFLRYFAFGESSEDKNLMTQISILHEQPVFDIFNSILVTRDGYDIHDVNLRNSVDVKIHIQPIVIEGCQLVNPLDEMNACKEAGLDWTKWLACEYTLEQKATVVGLYRLNRVIKAHQEDAVQIESERKNKPKG
jgi:hypothetical protein